MFYDHVFNKCNLNNFSYYKNPFYTSYKCLKKKESDKN